MSLEILQWAGLTNLPFLRRSLSTTTTCSAIFRHAAMYLQVAAAAASITTFRVAMRRVALTTSARMSVIRVALLCVKEDASIRVNRASAACSTEMPLVALRLPGVRTMRALGNAIRWEPVIATQAARVNAAVIGRAQT